MIRLLLIPALGAFVTVLLSDGSTSLTSTPSSAYQCGPALDVEKELHTGCERLIAIASSGATDASWAIAELRRTVTAPWASEALRAQATCGLRLVVERNVALAIR